MVMLVPGYKIFISFAISVNLFLEKWANSYPVIRMVEEV
jgi:hypothetical protein